MQTVWLESATSTNTLMSADSASYMHGDALAARSQTAGRGQRGNSWESEPGKNLTFSLMLRPKTIIPSEAFAVSMLTAIGVVRAIEKATGVKATLKWPNDIYVDDRKLVGILIENSFSASGIAHSIIGIGLNVNQDKFVSDAPNPVSLKQLCNCKFNLESLLEDLVAEIVETFDAYESAPDLQALCKLYNSMLWRRTGIWPWRDCLRNETVYASIDSVAPDGHLTLDTTPPRIFAFKEIAAIL